jgi:hypothetical protein
MRKIEPARISSRVNIENETVFYAVYVDDALYILLIVHGREFLPILDAAELNIFTGYSRWARIFNSRNGLPEYQEK